MIVYRFSISCLLFYLLDCRTTWYTCQNPCKFTYQKKQTTAELQAPDFGLALTECVYMFSKQLLVKCLDRMILFKRLGNVQEVLIIVNSDDISLCVESITGGNETTENSCQTSERVLWTHTRKEVGKSRW